MIACAQGPFVPQESLRRFNVRWTTSEFLTFKPPYTLDPSSDATTVPMLPLMNEHHVASSVPLVSSITWVIGSAMKITPP